jgi:hypothetical protein
MPFAVGAVVFFLLCSTVSGAFLCKSFPHLAVSRIVIRLFVNKPTHFVRELQWWYFRNWEENYGRRVETKEFCLCVSGERKLVGFRQR